MGDPIAKFYAYFPTSGAAVKSDHEGEAEVRLKVPLEYYTEAMKLGRLGVGKVLVVTIEEEDFSAEDNLGRRWRLITLSEGGTSCREGWTDDISKAVAAGDRLRIS